jgi:hypothetical protein
VAIDNIEFMAPMMNVEQPPYKAVLTAKNIPRPGPDLRELVAQARADGRAVWKLDGPLLAPRIEVVAVRGEDGQPMLFRPLAVDLDRRPYFRPGVLLWLETQAREARAAFRRHDRTQLRKLIAAASYDIHGLTYEEIADGWKKDPAIDDPGRAPATSPHELVPYYAHGERGVVDFVRDGRKLWSRLPAWPWAFFPDGRPPPTWRKQSPDRNLSAALVTWATGEPVLPEQ